MSDASLGSNDGVVYGQMMYNYPLPPHCAPNALIGFMFNDGDEDNLTPLISWTDMENLLHLYHHEQIQLWRKSLPRDFSVLEKINLKHTKNLCQAKIRYFCEID